MRRARSCRARAIARRSRGLPGHARRRRSPRRRASPTAPIRCLFGAHYLLTTNGVQRGELTADTAYVLDEQTRFDLRQRARQLHDGNRRAAGHDGGGSRRDDSTRTQILEGWGNVVVKLVDGRTLKSPHVIYNQITHQISSDTNYTVDARQRHASTGIGFTAERRRSRVQLPAQCSGNGSRAASRAMIARSHASALVRSSCCVGASPAAADAQPTRCSSCHVRATRLTSTRLPSATGRRSSGGGVHHPVSGARHHARRRQRRAVSGSRSS